MQEMPPALSLLNRSAFFIREHIGFMKLTDAYDILDPVTGAQLGLAKEEPQAAWLRLLIDKQILPTTVVVYEADGQTVALKIEKPFTFWPTRLSVYDGQGRFLGLLRTKFSLKRELIVEDANERPVGSFSGKWLSWTRELVDGSGQVIGTMDKKWSGLAKEFFTSADNYQLTLAPAAASQPSQVALLLAACLGYDLIFTEN
ncbi:MAG: phospholipid scramblase-related protein [Verrucomicrobia bacterium]|nr:phospholipid scramblase-related protein [Verrucomicrobiota bacterium]